MRACTALLLAVFCFSTTGCDIPQDPDLKITSWTHNKAGTVTINSTGPANSVAEAFVCTAVNGTQVYSFTDLKKAMVIANIDYDSQGYGTVTISVPFSHPPRSTLMIGVTKDNGASITREATDSNTPDAR